MRAFPTFLQFGFLFASLACAASAESGVEAADRALYEAKRQAEIASRTWKRL
jgi:hypothetical protein